MSKLLTMREAITKYWPGEAGAAPSAEELAAPGGPQAAGMRYNAWAKPAGAVRPDIPAVKSSAMRLVDPKRFRDVSDESIDPA